MAKSSIRTRTSSSRARYGRNRSSPPFASASRSRSRTRADRSCRAADHPMKVFAPVRDGRARPECTSRREHRCRRAPSGPPRSDRPRPRRERGALLGAFLRAPHPSGRRRRVWPRPTDGPFTNGPSSTENEKMARLFRRGPFVTALCSPYGGCRLMGEKDPSLSGDPSLALRTTARTFLLSS
jgi:hypothetical protein